MSLGPTTPQGPLVLTPAPSLQDYLPSMEAIEFASPQNSPIYSFYREAQGRLSDFPGGEQCSDHSPPLGWRPGSGWPGTLPV